MNDNDLEEWGSIFPNEDVHSCNGKVIEKIEADRNRWKKMAEEFAYRTEKMSRYATVGHPQKPGFNVKPVFIVYQDEFYMLENCLSKFRQMAGENLT